MSTLIYSSRWEIKRLALIYSENKQKNGDFSEQTALQFRFGEIVPKRQLALDLDLIETYRKYTIVQPGDLMLNGLNLNYDFVTQRVALVRKNGIITSAYISLRPRDGINTGYYCYLLKTLDSKKMFNGMGTGIRLTLSYNELRNMMLPVPPREEQDQIVRYLDWQVSKINKLISARKKQIVLLKEQKQAVINEAVTKGLDPAVPMKDSGVEWIGEIPAEWSLVPLYSIAKVISMTNKEDEELLSVYLDEGVIPFSQKEEKRTNPTSKDLSKYQYVRYGNLVLNNQQAWRGSVGVSKFEGIVSPAYIILELSKCLDTDYANLLFRGKNMVYQYGLASKGVGSIQRNLYWPHLKRAFVLLPPLPIQKEIVRYIVKRCAKIDALISNIHSEIALLVEYRTRLISDVVTGQIDVRDIEVPEFEYIADDVDDVSDDENTDLEEIMEEEE
jgi:type I restriction enzyme S subunit